MFLQAYILVNMVHSGRLIIPDGNGSTPGFVKMDWDVSVTQDSVFLRSEASDLGQTLPLILVSE